MCFNMCRNNICVNFINLIIRYIYSYPGKFHIPNLAQTLTMVIPHRYKSVMERSIAHKLFDENIKKIVTQVLQDIFILFFCVSASVTELPWHGCTN